jgi:HSP20 family protein
MSTGPEKSSATIDTPVDRIREIVANMIDVVATQGTKAIDTLGLRTPSKYWCPDIDVIETDENVMVSVDLPGVDPDRVEILLAGNMLTIKGERTLPESGSGKGIHRRERAHGPFSRSIPLPVAVNPELVSAASQQGVLVVRLAKEDRLKARQIPIKVNESS